MAAEKGNQYWKQRSKHGRDKLFKTPELLLEAANDYFQFVEDNPFYKSEAKVVSLGQGEGSEVQIVNIPVKRPFTLIGLCLYLDVNQEYFNRFEGNLDLEKEIDKDFNRVIKYIRDTIYNQKFEGAASNFFNANIIARDLGLIDKSDKNMKVEISEIDTWTPEQIKAEIERLESVK